MRFDEKVFKQIIDLFVPYAKPDSPGFAVGIIQADNVIFCQGFGQADLEHISPITPDTVFDVGSMSKQFVGMAIALLEQDGQLSIDDPLHKYLPDFPDYAKGVTLAHLMYHTSGIRSYFTLAYYVMGYHESDAITKEEVYDLLCRLRSLNFPPGERWEYCDSNYFLLAEIIERVTGKSLNQYAQEAIFRPLDMQNTLFRHCHSQLIRNRAVSYATHPIEFRSPYTYRDRSGDYNSFYSWISNYEHVGAEGLFTALTDLFKWSQNFSSNRLGKGGCDLIERVLTPGVQINEEIGYGYGLNVGRFRGKKFFGHNGAIHAYTSSMMHFLEENVSIICLSNQNMEGAWTYRSRIMDLIFPGCDGVTLSPMPRSQQEVDLQEQTILGCYQNPDTASIWEVVYKENGLYIRENKDREFEITRVRLFAYRSVDSNIQIRFETDSAGKVSAIRGVIGEQFFTFLPFLHPPPSTGDLIEYAGIYRSDELETTFIVDVDQQRLIVRNKNRHFCSMDLSYIPTIKDSFIAYDPNPTSSQITFLRQAGRIEAFVYRDYDGDGREVLKFERK